MLTKLQKSLLASQLDRILKSYKDDKGDIDNLCRGELLGLSVAFIIINDDDVVAILDRVSDAMYAGDRAAAQDIINTLRI